MALPKYLTGDPLAIKDFIDRFDVRTQTLLALSGTLLTSLGFLV